ncbi:MAG: hypothetical protein M3Q99_13335 [Acidobacteriota bacterium]|nr:hypothetical protein [Acidobacteriota bacterium]
MPTEIYTGSADRMSALSAIARMNALIKFIIEFNQGVFHRLRDIADRDVRAPTLKS